MAEYGDAFDVLADSDTWMKIGVAAGAFAGATVGRNVIEQRFGYTQVPDEAYGLGTVAGSAMFLDGDMSKFAIVGGGLHTVEALARRFNIKQRVENAGGN
ncbi:hypothetical protein ACFQMA_09305 [Halosimplex aquaticum]|uniref:Uncharacterized protein n=1 Tax=Halosimplex aquaticum TaxID=3026162 RepID=A0ABD5Y2Q2_9EURY|nr:hypothetical protein [Halosimplex aquaticum]